MTETQATQRAEMLTALRAFICQRPGMEPGNYASYKDYMNDYRRILRYRDDALELLGAVALYSDITPDRIALGAGSRLFWDADRKVWDYHTGQYFPTEYRRAAANALASILWDHWRDHYGATRQDIRRMAMNAFRSRRVRQYFA